MSGDQAVGSPIKLTVPVLCSKPPKASWLKWQHSFYSWICNLGTTWRGQLVSTLPGISGDGSKAGAWDHLKAPSLTCLVADAGCQLESSLACRPGNLHMTPPCGLGFLAAWWLGSKGKLLVREWARWKPSHFLWHRLWSLAPFLSLLLFWRGSRLYPLMGRLAIWKSMWHCKYCCGHFQKIQSATVCEKSVV